MDTRTRAFLRNSRSWESRTRIPLTSGKVYWVLKADSCLGGYHLVNIAKTASFTSSPSLLVGRGALKPAPNILGYTENLICTWKEEWTRQHWNTDLQRDTTSPHADLFHALYFSSSPLQRLHWSLSENFCKLWWPNKPDVSVVQICTFHAVWCNLKGPINIFCAEVTRSNTRYRAGAEMMHSLVDEDFRWARRCDFIPTEIILWGSYISFCI